MTTTSDALANFETLVGSVTSLQSNFNKLSENLVAFGGEMSQLDNLQLGDVSDLLLAGLNANKKVEKELVDGMKPFDDVVSKVGKNMNKLFDITDRVTQGFGMVKNTMKELPNLGNDVSGVINKMGGKVQEGLTKTFSGANKTVNDAFSSINSSVQPFIDTLKPIADLGPAMQKIQGVEKKISDSMVKVETKISAGIQKATDSVAKFSKKITDKATSGIMKFTNKIKTKLDKSKFGHFIITGVQKVISFTQKAKGGYIPRVSEIAKMMPDSMRSIAETLVPSLKGFLEKNKGNGPQPSLGKSILSTIGNIGGLGKAIHGNIFSGISSLAGMFSGKAMGQLHQSIGGFIGKLFSSGKGVVSTAKQSAKDVVAQVKPGAFDNIKAAGQALLKGKNPLDMLNKLVPPALKNPLNEAKNKIVGAVAPLATKGKEIGGSIINTAKNLPAIQNILPPAIKDKVMPLVTKGKEIGGSIINTAKNLPAIQNILPPAIKDKVMPLVTKGKEIGGSIINTAKNLPAIQNILPPAIRDKVMPLVTKGKEIGGSIINTAKNLPAIQNILPPAIRDKVMPLVTKGKEIGGSIINTAKNLPAIQNILPPAIRDKVMPLVTKGKEIGGSIINTAKNLPDSLHNSINSGVDGVSNLVNEGSEMAASATNIAGNALQSGVANVADKAETATKSTAVHVNSLINNLTIHGNNMKESAEEVRDMLLEELTSVLHMVKSNG